MGFLFLHSIKEAWVLGGRFARNQKQNGCHHAVTKRSEILTPDKSSQKILSLSMATRESAEVLISGGDGLLPVNTFQERARAVCYIQIIVKDTKTNRDRLRRGSGFYSTVVISGKEYHGIFTNNHVLSKRGEAQQAEAVFGYDNRNEGKRVSLRPDLIFRTNQVLDYSFIGVQKEDIQALQLGIFPIPLIQEPKISPIDQVFILQHPKGRPKEFSYDKIIAVEPPFVYYKADTETGSSGAPVFCKLNLVAVHQKGSEEQKYNKGVLCSEILSDLNTRTCKEIDYRFGIEEDSAKPSLCDLLCQTCFKNGCEMRSRECISTGDTRPNPFPFQDSQGQEIEQDIPRKRQKMEENSALSPSEEELEELAKEIITVWKPLGRKLGLGNSKIQEIARDNINFSGIREKAFQMLLSWKESSHNPSYDSLGNALIELGKRNLAQQYCHM